VYTSDVDCAHERPYASADRACAATSASSRYRAARGRPSIGAADELVAETERQLGMRCEIVTREREALGGVVTYGERVVILEADRIARDLFCAASSRSLSVFTTGQLGVPG
jgi:hypothetical protein